MWDPRLRPRPPSSAPTICSEAKSRWGKVGAAQGEEGAAAGSTGPTSAFTAPPTRTSLKQMSPIDELKVRSSLPPPTRAAHCGGWEEEGRGSGAGTKPGSLLGLQALSPTLVRPQRGVAAREPGAWPAGPQPDSLSSHPRPWAGGWGGRRPPALGVWVSSSWPGLGLELAPGDSPGGQILPPQGCRGPCLNPLGPEFHFLPPWKGGPL